VSWTSAADLRAQVQKLWDKGDFLRPCVQCEAMWPRRLRLLGPTSTELTERFDEVRAWMVDLRQASTQRGAPRYRIVMRERAILRELRQAAGQSCKVGEIVALFSTEANEATDQPPQRGIRFATATIIHHGGMWSGNVH